jgi:general secretion pathway protein B
MSYILEALKKAQAERQLGATPDVHAPTLDAYATRRAARPRWLPLVLGGGLVCAAAAAVLWWRHDAPSAGAQERIAPGPQQMAQAGGGVVAGQAMPAPPSTTGRQAGSPAAAAMPVAGAEAQAVPVAAAQGAAPGAAAALSTPAQGAMRNGAALTGNAPAGDASPGAPLSGAARTGMAPSGTAQAGVASSGVPSSNALRAGVASSGMTSSGAAQTGVASSDMTPPAASRQGRPAPAQQTAALNPAPQAAKQPGGSSPGQIDKPVSASAAPQPDAPMAQAAARPAPPSEPAEEPIPTARDLPEPIQRILPNVTMGGYMYSRNPADRLVLIDKALRREGDEVAPGLVLERLLPKGAVFTFRGYRYRVPY